MSLSENRRRAASVVANVIASVIASVIAHAHLNSLRPPSRPEFFLLCVVRARQPQALANVLQ
jgi:hypothetical protein